MHRPDAANMTADYRLLHNRANRYLQDREEMKTRSFIGMGSFFPGHDAFATESEGPIQDRTTERLGHTDKAIIQARRMLLSAIRDVQAGRDGARRPRSRGRPLEPVSLFGLMPAAGLGRSGGPRARSPCAGHRP